MAGREPDLCANLAAIQIARQSQDGDTALWINLPRQLTHGYLHRNAG